MDFLFFTEYSNVLNGLFDAWLSVGLRPVDAQWWESLTDSRGRNINYV
jgi:hypothetical protein